MSLKLQEQWNFLFESYFGAKGNELDRFISRAYRDMCRTFRIGKLDDKTSTEILNGAKQIVKEQFNGLTKTFPVNGKHFDQFDVWHNSSCKVLKNFYDKSLNIHTQVRLTYGQAQKWINMTMKYCWVCGGEEFGGLQTWFSAAHVAIDEVILIAVLKEKVVAHRPCVKWSKWDSEKEYKDFQLMFRNVAAKQNKLPLELEFEWWNKYRSELT
jgi:hypothetical protein